MDLWNTEDAIKEIEGLEISVPEWIDQDISPSTVAAIVQGGCASGAYMPAVTYHKAMTIMAEHGDDVLQYVEDNYGDLPAPKKGESWSGMAVYYLSIAVELWASSIEQELTDFEPEEEETEA